MNSANHALFSLNTTSPNATAHAYLLPQAGTLARKGSLAMNTIAASNDSNIVSSSFSTATSSRTGVFRSGQQVQQGVLLRVALLEDNSVECASIKRLFEENGYKVVAKSTGLEFLDLLVHETFDLLILDWNLPDISGVEIVQQMRNSMNMNSPVLMLTNRTSEYDVVQALNGGADDFLQKPWKPFELLARANALVRRVRNTELRQDERLSDFILDQKLMHLTRDGKIAKLSNKEFLLIQLLLRHIGTPVSRAHIVQSIWHGEEPEARTLDVHISRLRSKLNQIAPNSFNLMSIYGYGYRLEKLIVDES